MWMRTNLSPVLRVTGRRRPAASRCAEARRHRNRKGLTWTLSALVCVACETSGASHPPSMQAESGPVAAGRSATFEVIWSFKVGAGPEGLQFGRVNSLLLVAAHDGVIELWDYQEKKRVGVLTTGPRLTAVRLINDDKTLVAFHEDGRLTLWDLYHRKVERRIGQPSSRVAGFDADAVHNVAAICMKEKPSTIHLVDLMTGSSLGSLDGQVDNPEVWFSRDGKFLYKIAGIFDEAWKSAVERWSVTAKEQMPEVIVANGAATCFAVNNDNSVFAVGTQDGSVYLTRANTGAQPMRLPRANNWEVEITDVSFSRDGKWLAACTTWFKSHLAIWSVKTGKLVMSRSPEVEDVVYTALTWSPKDDLLAVGRSKGGVEVLRIKEGKE